MSDSLKLMSFIIDNYHFALSVDHIRDVLGKKNVDKVPLTHKGIKGVVNLRGNIVTVIDIIPLITEDFSSEEAELYIVVDVKSELYSISADKIVKFLNINKQDINDVPSSVHQTLADLSLGAIYVENELLLILDLEKILTILLKA